MDSGSPVIDTGTDVGITLDFYGNIIPYGVTFDIDAIEYYESISIFTPKIHSWGTI